MSKLSVDKINFFLGLFFSAVLAKNLLGLNAPGISLGLSILILIFLLHKGSIKDIKGILFIIATFTTLGVSSALASNYPIQPIRFTLGLWYICSIFLYFIAFKIRFTTDNAFYRFVNLIILIGFLIIIAGSVSILLYGQPISDYMTTYTIFRGLETGMDSAPVYSALVATIVPLLLYRSINEGRYFYAAIAVIPTLVIFSTYSRKTLIAVAVVWTAYIILRLGFVRSMLILVPVAATGFSIFFSQADFGRFAQLDLYLKTDPTDWVARTAMLITSIQIAFDNFPFGVGLGYFGSPPAAFMYSPVYSDYAISSVHGLSELREGFNNQNYLVDVFWPYVLGETGLIGLIFTIYIAIKPLKLFKKILSNKTLRNDKFIIADIFLFFSILSTALLESLGSPTLINPVGLIIFSGLLGAIYAKTYRAFLTKTQNAN
jgi:hypothetical protein